MAKNGADANGFAEVMAPMFGAGFPVTGITVALGVAIALIWFVLWRFSQRIVGGVRLREALRSLTGTPAERFGALLGPVYRDMASNLMVWTARLTRDDHGPWRHFEIGYVDRRQDDRSHIDRRHAVRRQGARTAFTGAWTGGLYRVTLFLAVICTTIPRSTIQNTKPFQSSRLS